jgi:hypothetical protein
VILSREQVEQLTIDQVNKAIKAIEKTKLLDKPLTKLSLEEYQMIEDLSNTILYLEDRLQWLEQYKHLQPAE